MSDPIYFGESTRTPLGIIWAAVSARGLTTVDFGISRAKFEAALARQTKRVIAYAPDRVAEITRQVKDYLEGKRRDFDLMIDWTVLGSDFQRAALRVVYSIPYGETRTYAEVAAQIGRPHAFRAVGRANATNPMPLVIPCHRVIGMDGKLHGYGAGEGIKTKEWLLKLEGVAP